VVPEILQEEYPFSSLKGGANVLVFPDLGSANVAYKLMLRIGGAEALGPILMGLRKPVHVLQRGASVEEIVSVAAIAVAHARASAEPAAGGEMREMVDVTEGTNRVHTSRL
jgi:malate dehydrogenase (oxaloacetate-decarboxylating)(NADP+)